MTLTASSPVAASSLVGVVHHSQVALADSKYDRDGTLVSIGYEARPSVTSLLNY